MPFTKETAAKAAAKRHQKAASTDVAVLDPPTPEAVEGEALASADDILADLLELGKGLKAAGDKKGEQAKILDQVADLLNKIDFRAYPELLNNPAISRLSDAAAESKIDNADLPPGSPVGEGWTASKKPWTMKDMRKFPTVELTPRETIKVIYNGVGFQLHDDVTVVVPVPVKEIYDEHRRGMKAADEHAQYMLKMRDDVPSDPSIIGFTSQSVRARATKGQFSPGMGLDLGRIDSDLRDPESSEGGEGGDTD